MVAANRDEFYGRDSARADYWNDEPDILAGRDLTAGGTWLGINQNGRFAAVTNFRETPQEPTPPRSRGELTTGFLSGDLSAEAYVASLADVGHEYRGFNLVVDDGHECYYTSNRIDQGHKLSPGTYGLSNQLLDCDWPKVNEGRTGLNRIVQSSIDDTGQLFELLFDQGSGSPFSNSFIATAEYGTCASTVLLVTTDGQVSFQEQGFVAGGKEESFKSYNFSIS